MEPWNKQKRNWIPVFPRSSWIANNKPYSYSRYWTGTSLQPRLIRGVFSNANDINLFLMIFRHRSLHSKLGPVQYREYDINLFSMIFPPISFHCKLIPVECYWFAAITGCRVIGHLRLFWFLLNIFFYFILSMLRNLTGGTVIIKDMQENDNGR